MAYYVRKFARAKWSLLERETEDIIDNYKAYTIANDMRTMGNTLSLWKVDSLSDADIEPVIVINSLLGDTISKLELMFIPEQFIENYTLEQDDGNTVVTNYCNLHYNITQLTVGKHILFAKEIMLKIIDLEKQNDNQPGHQPLIRRYKEKDQLGMIEKWIQMGEIDFSQLKEKQQKAIADWCGATA